MWVSLLDQSSDIKVVEDISDDKHEQSSQLEGEEEESSEAEESG